MLVFLLIFSNCTFFCNLFVFPFIFVYFFLYRILSLFLLFNPVYLTFLPLVYPFSLYSYSFFPSSSLDFLFSLLLSFLYFLFLVRSFYSFNFLYMFSSVFAFSSFLSSLISFQVLITKLPRTLRLLRKVLKSRWCECCARSSLSKLVLLIRNILLARQLSSLCQA